MEENNESWMIILENNESWMIMLGNNELWMIMLEIMISQFLFDNKM